MSKDIEKRDDCAMSTKDQLEALLEENYNKYPDAIDWMMAHYNRVEKLPQSKYERFMEQLNGDAEFTGFIYDPIRHNIVPLIKLYRQTHGKGLKESKERIEWFIANNYYDQLPADRQRGYGYLRDGF